MIIENCIRYTELNIHKESLVAYSDTWKRLAPTSGFGRSSWLVGQLARCRPSDTEYRGASQRLIVASSTTRFAYVTIKVTREVSVRRLYLPTVLITCKYEKHVTTMTRLMLEQTLLQTVDTLMTSRWIFLS